MIVADIEIEKYFILTGNKTIYYKYSDFIDQNGDIWVLDSRDNTNKKIHAGRFVEECFDKLPKNKSCVFAGSFDPFTYGHKEIVKQLINEYVNVYILIAVNEKKEYTFSIDEKKEIINRTLTDLPDTVKVRVLDKGKTVGSYAYENDLVIVKGVRNSEDEYYESQLATFNKDYYNVDTYYIKTEGHAKFISSSFVKQVRNYSVDVSRYVHPFTQYLFNKKDGREILGVTGSIASGKSTIIKTMYKDYQVINMDELAKTIYECKTNVHTKLVNELINILNDDFKVGVVSEDNLKETLKKYMFRKPKIMKMVDEHFEFEIRRMVTEKLSSMNGKVIIECASFDKFPYLIDLCDHNIVYIKKDADTRHKRLIERNNLSEYDAAKIIKGLGNDEDKIKKIKEHFDDYFGKFKEIDIELDEENVEKFFVWWREELTDILDIDCFRDMLLEYQSSDRHYHNLKHLRYMFDKSYGTSSLKEELGYDRYFLSIFYHDYYVKGSSPEMASATKLQEDILGRGKYEYTILVSRILNDIFHTATHKEETWLNKLDL